MGNPKQKWTAEEEEALRAGVAKYGKGNWKLIQRDPEFSPFLSARSNIDLKDKWRNLSGGPGGNGSREKSRSSKHKPSTDGQKSPAVVKQSALPKVKPLIDDSSKSFTPNRYNEMIIEAVSVLNEPNGSDNRAIVGYIEAGFCSLFSSPGFMNIYFTWRKATVILGKGTPDDNFICFKSLHYSCKWFAAKGISNLKFLRLPTASIKLLVLYDILRLVEIQMMQKQEVPQSFKKQLCSRLKRLVALEKLEKVDNRYKIRKDETFGIKIPSPKQNGMRPKQLQNGGHITCDAVEEASVTAAYLIAEAENKSFLAAEAVKEAERVSKVAEDTDSLLQLAKEIFETCSQGEIVLIS
ncbi:hypothetical protein V6N11_066824 [Hibiscus sabdariffa]|uniref:MYB transcription factor n=1 Tax=Hibiscus sabdariffa TaxID=183260 RepID=A0ABR2SNU2_9ROSI